ncbi:MAG: hypothetical protein ABW107_14655 [Candidatus Thiodiazotropha sp. 6PLUC5]
MASQTHNSNQNTRIKTRGEKHYVMIYSRYERFWHWSQAFLIFTLFYTGLGLHGTHDMLDFKTAVVIHTYGATDLL